MTAPRDFDLVLQGATGFTGQLAASELKRHAPEGFQWAIAGRSQERLWVMSEDLGVPMLVADGLDLRAVDALARQSRVVISCAGPFARFGTPLVDACVAHQTHYADITGELPWIQSLGERHGATCLDSGTTLIPASGFDSVPSDLAVHALVTALPEAMPVFGFFSLRGGLNGGTLHSGIALAEDHPSPFPSLRPVFPAPSLGAWGAPFVMGPVNESVVGRSALDLAESVAGYGRGFEYVESLKAGGRFSARLFSGGLRATQFLFTNSLGRRLLNALGPKPGSGPSERQRVSGFARLELLAGSLEEPTLRQTWNWKGDPGNTITVACLVQTGLALAAGEATSAGVRTPASGLGTSLLRRLKDVGAVSVS